MTVLGCASLADALESSGSTPKLTSHAPPGASTGGTRPDNHIIWSPLQADRVCHKHPVAAFEVARVPHQADLRRRLGRVPVQSNVAIGIALIVEIPADVTGTLPSQTRRSLDIRQHDEGDVVLTDDPRRARIAHVSACGDSERASESVGKSCTHAVDHSCSRPFMQSYGKHHHRQHLHRDSRHAVVEWTVQQPNTRDKQPRTVLVRRRNVDMLPVGDVESRARVLRGPERPRGIARPIRTEIGDTMRRRDDQIRSNHRRRTVV